MAATVPATPAPENALLGVTSIHRLTGAYIAVALAALAIANIPGILQALDHAGVDLYPHVTPVIHNYYQGLTIHGVLNALVWTTFFICGFLSFVTVYALRRGLSDMRLAWIAFWVMTGGLVLAAIPILLNEASVLYTFYPPLQAHWGFYIGLTLVVVATWIVAFTLLQTWRHWQRDNPGERTPLAVYATLMTFAMWSIASLGIASEMLFLLIPWSLGIVDNVDPLLARTLFWFTGHPIVYFWLLPAYISWYTMVPRMAGGRLFSEPMARVAFILFLLYSIPVGLHHQMTDAGIGENIKLVHTFLTFAVFFPSLLTYFNVGASLELAGRRKGGGSVFGWVFKLPWGNPSLTAQLLAMVLFVFGGIGGLANASYNVNLTVHNTTWVVGHFHLTVGAAVTLTFMGICYWLVPLLRDRALWSRWMALAQVVLYFVGMAIWSETMHRVGLDYIPRRTPLAQAPWAADELSLSFWMMGIGGLAMIVSGILFFLNLALTMWVSKEPANVEVPLMGTREYGSHAHVPRVLDSWKPWLIITFVLIAIAYGPVFFHLLTNISSVRGFPGVW
jgi:cytochrome c oxidase subunit I